MSLNIEKDEFEKYIFNTLYKYSTWGDDGIFNGKYK